MTAASRTHAQGGTGFPPFRGGLLRYADTLGSAYIVERLRLLEAKHGSRFAPVPPLLRLAAKGGKFRDEYRRA